MRAQTRGFRFYLETGYPGRLTAPGSLLRCLSMHMHGTAARRRWRGFLTRLGRPGRPSRNETPDTERRLRRAAEVQMMMEALEDPVILAVDGLQFWDEVSLELLIELLRSLDGSGAAEQRLALVLAYREEGPQIRLLREITRSLLPPPDEPKPSAVSPSPDPAVRHAAVISLAPLGLEETFSLFRERGGEEEPSALAVFQETGGRPGRIVALATRSGPADGVAGASGGAATAGFVDPGREGRRLLLTLLLLARPVGCAELSRHVALPRRAVERTLSLLRSRKLAAPSAGGPRGEGWLATPAARKLLESAADSERRKIHRSVAREIVRRAATAGTSVLEEAVRHFQAAGSSTKVVQYGIPAARYLKSTFQNRSALRVFRAMLRALPEKRFENRLELAVEMAGLHVRVGDLDEGIAVLRDLLPGAGKQSSLMRTRAVLWLALLNRRRGDFRARGQA